MAPVTRDSENETPEKERGNDRLSTGELTLHTPAAQSQRQSCPLRLNAIAQLDACPIRRSGALPAMHVCGRGERSGQEEGWWE
jgi:hypothetical protein